MSIAFSIQAASCPSSLHRQQVHPDAWCQLWQQPESWETHSDPFLGRNPKEEIQTIVGYLVLISESSMPWHPPSSWKDQTWESQVWTIWVFTDIRDILTNTARLLWTILVWHFSESLICTWHINAKMGAQPNAFWFSLGERNDRYKYCISVQVAKTSQQYLKISQDPSQHLNKWCWDHVQHESRSLQIVWWLCCLLALAAPKNMSKGRCLVLDLGEFASWDSVSSPCSWTFQQETESIQNESTK